MSEEQRAKLKALADGIEDEDDLSDHPQLKSYGLSLKKPGLKALMGDNNPLKSDEADELEQFFRLRKS